MITSAQIAEWYEPHRVIVETQHEQPRWVPLYTCRICRALVALILGDAGSLEQHHAWHVQSGC